MPAGLLPPVNRPLWIVSFQRVCPSILITVNFAFHQTGDAFLSRFLRFLQIHSFSPH